MCFCDCGMRVTYPILIHGGLLLGQRLRFDRIVDAVAGGVRIEAIRCGRRAKRGASRREGRDRALNVVLLVATVRDRESVSWCCGCGVVAKRCLVHSVILGGC